MLIHTAADVTCAHVCICLFRSRSRPTRSLRSLSNHVFGDTDGLMVVASGASGSKVHPARVDVEHTVAKATLRQLIKDAEARAAAAPPEQAAAAAERLERLIAGIKCNERCLLNLQLSGSAANVAKSDTSVTRWVNEATLPWRQARCTCGNCVAWRALPDAAKEAAYDTAGPGHMRDLRWQPFGWVG